jgi:hypothetical protein
MTITTATGEQVDVQLVTDHPRAALYGTAVVVGGETIGFARNAELSTNLVKNRVAYGTSKRSAWMTYSIEGARLGEFPTRKAAVAALLRRR